MKKSENIKMLCKPTPLAKERGASSLEYLILATVIVAILALLGTSGLGETVTTAFTDLFNDATTVDTGTSGGSGDQ